jgi:hypothetical protein
MQFAKPSLILALSLALAVSISNARAQGAGDCRAAARIGWSAEESWTWQQVCAGEMADLEKGFPNDAAPRRLSAAFLSSLLFDSKLKSLIPHNGVHIAGARIAEPLRLGDAAPGFELALERIGFLDDVDLHGLQASDDVSFAGSRFIGSLDMEGASFGGNLRLAGAVVAGELSLVGARIGGSANLDRIGVAKGLNLERIAVAHNLLLRHAALPGVDLLGGSVKADLLLRDSSISGWAWLENLDIGSDLFMERARLERTDLPGARIGGNLVMTGASIDGPADLRGIKIGQDLLMDGAGFRSVAMPDADIGYNLRFDGSRVAEAISMPSGHVGHTLSMGQLGSFDGHVDLGYVRVDGGVRLTRSIFAGGVGLDGAVIGQDFSVTEGALISGLLRMTFARVGANVDLTGGSFDSVDLTGTIVGAEIRLASRGYAAIAWRPAAKLVLRNVSAKALQDLPDAWPTTVDLEGFTYQQLGGYRESQSNDVAARSAQSFIAWLAKQPQYSPQPYRTLAEVLRGAGFPDKAKQVLYAGFLREWRGLAGLAWFWQGLRWAIIGFGLYPQRSAIWILILVPLGAIIVGFEPQVRLRRMRLIDRLIYSLDALLPFVTLRQEHNAFDLQSWPKYYLYFHKVMGYVLIAFLLSAVTSVD